MDSLNMDNPSYRTLLQDISSELSRENVMCLKFLVQPLIQKRMFGNIEDGLGFMDALEDCNRLSPRNLSFLSELLETIRRLDLQARLDQYIISSDAIRGNLNEVCPFRKMLFKLREDIPDADMVNMRFLCGDAIPKRAVVEDPLELFTILIQEQRLQPNKLKFLKSILADISRMDLCDIVSDFADSVSPSQCNYPSQTRGLVYTQPALESSSFSSSSMASSASSSRSMPSYSFDSMPHSPQNPMLPSGFHSQISTFVPHSIEDNNVIVSSSHSEPMDSSDPSVSGVLECGDTPNVKLESSCDGGGASAGDQSDCYKMDARPRGVCLIFDVNTFNRDPQDQQATDQENRPGSKIDSGRLKQTFERLHFTVNIVENPSDERIVSIVKGVSQRDHSHHDCLVICILSHGNLGYFFGSNGRPVHENCLITLLSAQSCPSLANKPKLLFFSCCRGQDHQPGVTVTDIETDIPRRDHGPLVPNEADFFLGHATLPNSVSYRSKSKGTFYVQKLTQVLDQEANRSELQHMMLRVNREVAQEVYPAGQPFMQMPRPEHSLRKKLYFLSGNDIL